MRRVIHHAVKSHRRDRLDDYNPDDDQVPQRQRTLQTGRGTCARFVAQEVLLLGEELLFIRVIVARIRIHDGTQIRPGRGISFVQYSIVSIEAVWPNSPSSATFNILSPPRSSDSISSSRLFTLHSRTGHKIHRTVSLRSLAPRFDGNALIRQVV